MLVYYLYHAVTIYCRSTVIMHIGIMARVYCISRWKLILKIRKIFFTFTTPLSACGDIVSLKTPVMWFISLTGVSRPIIRSSRTDIECWECFMWPGISYDFYSAVIIKPGAIIDGSSKGMYMYENDRPTYWTFYNGLNCATMCLLAAYALRQTAVRIRPLCCVPDQRW